MCCFYHTSNTINLVTATKYTAFGIIEYCVFVKDLIDCSATTHGVIFAKYVAQITKQQGRYAVGHRVLPFEIVGCERPDIGLILRPFGSTGTMSSAVAPSTRWCCGPAPSSGRCASTTCATPPRPCSCALASPRTWSSAS